MASPELARFVASMSLGYEQWHDGDGYDLAALAGMTAGDRTAAEGLLLENLAEHGDWRDVEALAALGTATASAALRAATRHSKPEVRNRALAILAEADPQADTDLEENLVRAVKAGALELAQSHPTPRVKRALLDCCRLGDPVTRVNAAAMLLYLCGQAAEPFDWSQRPFFLRFGSEDSAELRAVWTELRQRTGI
jgi:hypothetical protein